MRLVAFLFSNLVGFVIGHYLLTGSAAAYVSIIVSYHLYLGILVVMSEKRAGISLPILSTTFTHLAFLTVVVGLPILRRQIPFFSLVSLFVPALAPFEVDWLFSSEKKRDDSPSRKKQAEVIPVEKLLNEASTQDYSEFLEYMKQTKRAFQKSGRGIREEYAYWLADRAAKRAKGIAAGKETSIVTEAADA